MQIQKKKLILYLLLIYLCYKMRREHSSATLPYTPITCIIGTGTQYINTLYKFTDNTHKHRFIMRYAKTGTSTNNQTHIFGSSTSSDTLWFNGYTDANAGYSTQCYIGSTGRIIWVFDNDLAAHTIDFTLQNNTTILKVDSNTTTPNYYGAIVSNSNIFLFCSSKGTNVSAGKSRMKLYYCKIYESDVLVRDFIPVLDQNNVACLYDLVSQTFFYNAGTGTFNYEA